MSIKLEMLRTFSVTAAQGTLAVAAAVLGRTPSAVSMMLAQFEEEVGCPLFKTDRKSRLTPLGQLVLLESQRATDVFDKSANAIRRHAMSTTGIVRIAAVPSATVALLPDVIEAFRAVAVSEELSCRLGSRRLASPDDKTQPLSLFQNITRDHPPGGDDVCPVPIVAAECGGFVARTGHRHLPRNRSVLVEPLWPGVCCWNP